MTLTVTNTANDASLLVGGVEALKFNQGGTNDTLYHVAASVATNALTLTLNPCVIKFRSTTLTDGTTTTVSIGTPLTLTVPDTATLGTTNAVAARLVLVALNNAGTGELAVVNMSGGVNLDESGVISTTAMSTAADSATVVYSTTARTNVAYKVVGFIDITEATAGTYATAPTLVQGSGGQALTAMSSLGYGQTWQVVTGSRALATTYYNTTGKPITVNINGSATSGVFTPNVAGVNLAQSTGVNGSTYPWVIFVVPPGSAYSLTSTAPTISSWYELR